MRFNLHKKSSALLLLVNGLFFIASITGAQNHEVDSLLSILKTEKEDTIKVKTLNDVALLLYGVNPDSTILLTQQALILSQKLEWKKGKANSYRNAILGYWAKGNYTMALDNNLKALKMFKELGDRQEQERNLSMIGIIYFDQGDYPKALDYDLQALKLAEEVKDKKGMALDLCNIGIIYWNQNDYRKALDYDERSLKIAEELGDNQGQQSNFCNIGGIYMALGNYSKALNYYFNSLKIAEELKDKQVQIDNLGNIGDIYMNQRDYHKAYDYCQEALKIAKETGNKQGQERNLTNMGLLYTETGKYILAEETLKEAIRLDSTIGSKNDLRTSEDAISHLYDTTGRYKLALEWLKKANVLKDTLFNIDKNKAITSKELTFQFEQKEAAEKAEQDKKDAVAQQERNKERIVRNAFIGGFALMLALAFLILRGYRQKQKANKLISEEKTKVEEKQKEILDSINYAKRLQSAILPPVSLVKQYFPESFILYKPKDIVAGDFYWLQKVKRLDGKGDIILIAAADCTGHGVPGAMVSVVCSNAINRIVKETEVRDTGSVLDNVRDVVLETFSTSEGEVKDGMDISLCAINLQANILEWTGANNPLWYIHKSKLIEITPDKQPVGIQDNAKPFTTHLVNIEKGDTIYLFTDGYADQFGGPKGKKFKYKQLQQLLLDNVQLTMEEQKAKLEKALHDWMGNLEQVDDILIMGIKV